MATGHVEHCSAAFRVAAGGLMGIEFPGCRAFCCFVDASKKNTFELKGDFKEALDDWDNED